MLRRPFFAVRFPPRVILGFSLGVLVGGTNVAAQGCIIPDQCIVFLEPGYLMCKVFQNALDLDSGLPLVDENELPEACLCASGEERDILLAGPGAPGYEVLISQLDLAARQACVEMAFKLGVQNHNCITEDEVLGELQDRGRQDDCPITDCEIQATGDEECPDVCEFESPTTSGGDTDGTGAGDTTGAGGTSGGGAPPWAPDGGPRLRAPEGRP